MDVLQPTMATEIDWTTAATELSTTFLKMSLVFLTISPSARLPNFLCFAVSGVSWMAIANQLFLVDPYWSYDVTLVLMCVLGFMMMNVLLCVYVLFFGRELRFRGDLLEFAKDVGMWITAICSYFTFWLEMKRIRDMLDTEDVF